VNELSAVRQMHCFQTFAVTKYLDHETGVVGHLRPLEMMPFDGSHMTSC